MYNKNPSEKKKKKNPSDEFMCITQVMYKEGASLIAQLVKNSPAVQETLVQFLGWEDPLEKG